MTAKRKVGYRPKEIFKDWTDVEWFGNPDLNLDAKIKTFQNPFNGRNTPVWVFGSEKDFSYVVNAGKSSDYSYTGYIPKGLDLDQACAYVDEQHKAKKIFK